MGNGGAGFSAVRFRKQLSIVRRSPVFGSITCAALPPSNQRVLCASYQGRQTDTARVLPAAERIYPSNLLPFLGVGRGVSLYVIEAFGEHPNAQSESPPSSREGGRGVRSPCDAPIIICTCQYCYDSLSVSSPLLLKEATDGRFPTTRLNRPDYHTVR